VVDLFFFFVPSLLQRLLQLLLLTDGPGVFPSDQSIHYDDDSCETATTATNLLDHHIVAVVLSCISYNNNNRTIIQY